jgi:hypothetical protein
MNRVAVVEFRVCCRRAVNPRRFGQSPGSDRRRPQLEWLFELLRGRNPTEDELDQVLSPTIRSHRMRREQDAAEKHATHGGKRV